MHTHHEMHKWVFHFVKGGEQKRSIEKEMAVELLRLLLDAAKYPLVTPFLEFLTAQKVWPFSFVMRLFLFHTQIS